MSFDIDQDFSIFDDFLKKRPHYKAEALRRDLRNYYVPFVSKLIAIKEQRNGNDGLIIGISAIQGAGKTTQGEILEALLSHLGYPSCSLSIDDHYLTHEDLTTLRNEDAGFTRRGVTHDISLAIEDLTRLKTMKNGEPIVVAGYDKGAHHGDGDRFRWVKPTEGITLDAQITKKTVVVDKLAQVATTIHIISATYKGTDLKLPKDMGSDLPVLDGFLPSKLCKYSNTQNEVQIFATGNGDTVFQGADKSTAVVPKDELPKGWRLITEKPAFIFYDGWMLGAFPVTNESVFDADLPGLESEESKQWARTMNIRLGLYEPLWNMIDFLTILYVPNYHMSLLWREQAEQALRANGRGMTSREIQEFVHYFWRSVHPAIHIKNLAHDSTNTHQVVVIDDDRSIKEVLTPDKAKLNYA
jgi:pantothenate kinase-related protein Tda10